MTAGRKDLRKLQLGLESTPGTAVAATTVWRGPVVSLSDDREVVDVDEQVGILDGTDRSYIPKLLASYEIPETEATFEQLPHILAMAFGGNTTGVADGSGSSGYTYTATIPTTSAPTIKAYTIEAGDDFEAEECEYTHCTEFTLSGVGAEAVKLTGKLQGRQATRTTFTGALSRPTVEEALASKGKLWLDAIGDTIGTTQVSNQLLAWSITYKIKWIPKYTQEGNLYFTFPQYAGHTIEGEITFEHDTITSGNSQERANWRSQTAKLMRLQTSGSAYGTAGSGTLNSGLKTLRIDHPIKWKSFSVLEEQDGNDIIKATFRSRYNVTAATSGSIIVTNELSALP